MPKSIIRLFSGVKKLFLNKKTTGFLILVILVFIMLPNTVHAGLFDFFANISDFVANLLANIIIPFLGGLFVLFVSILVEIAKFNQFIDLPMVETGWSLTRDVANMFFIVVLLIIAFSTILKIQSYHYQKTLGKLVIMAILINFSKLIAGFLIDFFQVIMLTFVNGFKDAAGGNFAHGMGIYDMLSKNVAVGETGGGEQTTAYLLAIVMLIVADMTILIMIAVLLWRIAMLWVLVIISPLAYLAYAGMPKYWSQWWSEFFKHLVSGPVIAFFLWLTLLTIQQGSIETAFEKQEKRLEQSYSAQTNNDNDKLFSSNISIGSVINYMVVIALLMGGLTVSQKMAAQSGSAVGNFASKVQRVGTRAAMFGTGAAAVGWIGRKGIPDAYKWGARKIGKKAPGMYGLLRADQTIKKFREGLQHKSQLEEMEIETEQGKNLEKGDLRGLISGMGSRDFAYNVHGFLGIKGMAGMVKGKAQTARSMAKEVTRKREEQQKHMDMVNRPNADQAFVDDLQVKYNTAHAQFSEYKGELETQEARVFDKRDESEKLFNQANKAEKEGNSREASKLFNQASKLNQEADELENSDDYQNKRKEISVKAYGYRGALEGNYIQPREVNQIRRKLGSVKSSKEESEQAKKEHETWQKKLESAKDGNQSAQQEIDDKAKEHFENKYQEIIKQQELLKAGGLNEGQKEEKKGEVSSLEDKIKLSERDLKLTSDKDEIDKLNQIIKELKNNKNKTELQLNADSADKIKKSFTDDEIKKNKKENEELIGSLEKETRSVEQFIKNPRLTQVQRKENEDKARAIEDDIKKDEEKMKKIASYIPQAYYSRQTGRMAMNEEMKKIDTSNEDELVSLFENAMRTKNQSKALAVTAAAAKVGHLNEIVQSQQASKTIEDDKGNILAKAGEHFKSGIEGLHAFTEDVLVGRLGMSKQNAYGYENDFSDIAQEGNHWTFAQAMGVENGQFVQRDRHAQQTYVAIEKGKQDFEGLMRRSNRLGWTTEQYIDPKDSSSGRTTVLNSEGIDAIRSNFKAIEGLISKQRFNINLAANLTTSNNMKIFDQIGKTLPAHEKKEWNKFMDSLLGYVNKTREQAYRDKAVGTVQSGKITEAEKLRKMAGVSL